MAQFSILFSLTSFPTLHLFLSLALLLQSYFPTLFRSVTTFFGRPFFYHYLPPALSAHVYLFCISISHFPSLLHVKFIVASVPPIFPSCLLSVIIHSSLAYIAMDLTIILYKHKFVALEIILDLNNLLYSPTALLTFVIRFWISRLSTTLFVIVTPRSSVIVI